MNNAKPANYPATPTLDKIKAIQDQSQQIGCFLEWLFESRGLEICRVNNLSGGYLPANRPEELLADYFGIDQAEAEKERQAVYEYAAEFAS